MFNFQRNRREDLAPAPGQLNDKERVEWLRLIRSENVGPITFYQLLQRFGSAGAALEALPNIARRGGSKKLHIASKSEAEDEIAKHQSIGSRLILACEPDYPAILSHIEDAPPVLSVKGHAHLLQKPCIGIVGTRNASAAGRKFTEKLAADLGQAGYIIASGLARGIDASAHRASLAAGTIAVVAGGIDQIYPPEHAELYEQIGETGLIVSEIEFGISPQARHFPRRNRIISGLSLGVAVIEAALQSGSLITARMALEQNRELFAVPGSPLDPRCQGPNSLIKQGAHLLESAADIIEALRHIQPPSVSAKSDVFFKALAYMQQVTDQLIADSTPKIVELLSATPTQVDELIRLSGLPAPLVHCVLMELELGGRLQRFSGNKVALIYH